MKDKIRNCTNCKHYQHARTIDDLAMCTLSGDQAVGFLVARNECLCEDWEGIERKSESPVSKNTMKLKIDYKFSFYMNQYKHGFYTKETVVERVCGALTMLYELNYISVTEASQMFDTFCERLED